MQISFKGEQKFTLFGENTRQLARSMETDLKDDDNRLGMGFDKFTFNPKTGKGSFIVLDKFDGMARNFLSNIFPSEHNLLKK